MTAAKPEILIVEDSRTQAMVLQNVLEKNGFTVASATNGRAALDLLQTLRPVLVITDVQMPGMDGYELCASIKADAALRAVPVMLLTSLSAPQDIIRGLESGADNFVVKPYEEPFLLSRIETILANQELRRAAGHEEEIAVFFAGQQYVITSDRRQILNLLLSTYETAVQTNHDLIKAHEELKAAQGQLIEAEKLQSVGRLAAGIAHEVRNPLAILEMGISFLVERPMAEDDRVVIDEMREAVRRANSVITGLMDLSSPNELGMREMNVNDVIAQALAIFSDQLAERKIEVRRALAEGLQVTRLDVNKMEQVFLNVFANARDSMPSGGVLTVSTRQKLLEKKEVDYDAGDRSGSRFRAGDRAVIIEISDTGAGLPDEKLNKVFDPFFSTKPTGKGMGLGLTVAKKIIDLHGGKIALENLDGGGVKVTIVLKCAS